MCTFFIIDKAKAVYRKSINKRKAVSFDSNMIFFLYPKQKQQSNPEGLLLDAFDVSREIDPFTWKPDEKFKHSV